MSILAPMLWTVRVRWPDGSETETQALADPDEDVQLELSRN